MDAADWFDRLVNEPDPDGPPEAGETARSRPRSSRSGASKRVGGIGRSALASIPPRVYYATKRHRLISVDVQSFYPTLIPTKGIGPAAFGDTAGRRTPGESGPPTGRQEGRQGNPGPAEQERLTVQADGLKLVLNSFFGKTGDPYSTCIDPGAFLAVTLSGQLHADRSDRAIDRARESKYLSANTDGFSCKCPK